MALSKVFVLYHGTDANYRLLGVWEDEMAARAAALDTIQTMWDECQCNDIARPEVYEDIHEWNEWWDTEPDMQVALYEAPFHSK